MSMLEQHSVQALCNIYKDNNELIRTLINTRSHTYLSADNINTQIESLYQRNDTIINTLVRNLDIQIINTSYANNLMSNTRNSRRANARNTLNQPSENNIILDALNDLSQTPVPNYPSRQIRPRYVLPNNFFLRNRNLINNFLAPVQVFPTPAQIHAATMQIRYGDIPTPLNTECPISLEVFTEDETVTLIRHCNHIFRNNEINSWFRSNCRCPVCRYDIRDFSSNNTETNTTTVNTTTTTTNETTNTTNTATESNNDNDMSNNSLQEIVDRLLSTLTYDDITSADTSNNDVLATFYFTYR